MNRELPLEKKQRLILVEAEKVLRGKADSPLARYKTDPLQFFRERGVNFFPLFKQLLEDIYFNRVQKAVVLAPRGGGKTFGAALLATALFLLKDFDIGIVAGSETQALTLYGYITEWLDLPEMEHSIDEIKKTTLRGTSGNRIVARTASARSIRGLHLGRGKRGAFLIIDEEAEADEDVVRAARYVVRTAKPAIILRSSTYHKLTGSFARLVENHKTEGYTLYRWGSFDIAKPCPYDCSVVKDKEHPNGCPVAEFKDKYCKGKAKNASGWISIDEIVGEWMDSSRETFEVEVMGMRPASSGLVIQADDIDRAVDLGERGFPSEFERSWFCIDWGFAGMTAVVVLGLSGGKVFVRHTEAFSRHGIEAIVEKLKKLRPMFNAREVFADSSHPFENCRLRDEGFAVWGKNYDQLGIPFVSFKEEGVSILSYLFEKGHIGIGASEHLLLRQFRTWRRDQHGHIVKKDDHFPDSLIAGMMKLKKIGIGMGGRGHKITTVSRRLFATGARIGRGIKERFL